MLVVPDLGELELLRLMLGAALAVDESLRLKLYVNDLTPNRESVVGDFTECSLTGYVAKTLNRADWQAPTTVSGYAKTFYTSAPQVWTITGGSQIVYGYYVTNAAGTICYWAERFAAPSSAAAGSVIQVRPVMQLRSESQPAPP